MEKPKNGMTVSKFAALCGVSRQTLIYYDKIGLFHPSFTDKKGYRYYTLGQQEEFSLITMLTKLNTPLEEIQDYLEHKSPETFIRLLQQKKQSAEDQIERLSSIAQLIEERIKITREATGISDTDKITIDFQPKERLILSDTVDKTDSSKIPEIVGELENILRRKNIDTFGFGAVVNRKNLKLPFVYKIECFYIKTDTNKVKTELKPAGMYASICHRGSYETISESYIRLIGYLKENGLSATGNAYETDLLSSYTQKLERDYLTRISIGIAKKQTFSI